MKPLTDLKKLALYALLGVLALAGALWAVYDVGHDAGAAATQREWNKAEEAHRTAGDAARATYNARLEAERLANLKTNLKVSEEHEKELVLLRRQADADRLRIDRLGGLRIPAPACPSNRPVGGTAGTEAAGAGEPDAPGSAATIRLPLETENSLWALVDDADRVSAQLRSCQAWIRHNGFYGPEVTDSPLLLDRMIAAPNPHAEEAPQ